MKYKRIMLKLSGEALLGNRNSGVDPEFTLKIAKEIKEAYNLGTQIAIVIGGGNFFRGISAAENGLERVTGDHIGMLATLMNALTLQERLEKLGLETRVQDALGITKLAEPYIRRKAIHHLERGRIVIFASGTGNPFFSTDMAAVLRASEVECEIVLKATKVDGIYDKDPNIHKDAVKFEKLAHHQALVSDSIKVMDDAAIAHAKENRLPIRVFDINGQGNITRIIKGENVGTLVTHN